jgi:hypothetical protein
MVKDIGSGGIEALGRLRSASLSSGLLSLCLRRGLFRPVPGADRAAVPYCLFGGPILFTSLAIAMFLFRSVMRSRIQPNRDFPPDFGCIRFIYCRTFDRTGQDSRCGFGSLRHQTAISQRRVRRAHRCPQWRARFCVMTAPADS